MNTQDARFRCAGLILIYYMLILHSPLRFIFVQLQAAVWEHQLWGGRLPQSSVGSCVRLDPCPLQGNCSRSLLRWSVKTWFPMRLAHPKWTCSYLNSCSASVVVQRIVGKLKCSPTVLFEDFWTQDKLYKLSKLIIQIFEGRFWIGIFYITNYPPPKLVVQDTLVEIP